MCVCTILVILSSVLQTTKVTRDLRAKQGSSAAVDIEVSAEQSVMITSIPS